jgi:predicted outer membrane repeat protein
MRYGGAIYSETTAALTLRDVDLLDNFSFSDGGAVYYDGLLNSNATLTYYNSARFGSSTFYVQDNTSLEGSGGGFFVKDANLLHVYSTTVRAIIGFINNQALYNGGAICVENTGIGDSGYGIILGKTPGINDYNSATYFSSNDAGENGGAIYMVDSGSFYAYENVDIYDNVAGADPFLANGIGLDNIASWTGEGKGGAIYVKNSGDFTFKYSSDVYRNTARNFGGAFYIEDCGIVNIYYASFGDNASGEYYLGSSNWLTVGDSTVANAGQGGGLYLKGNGNIILNDLDFYDNHATAEGGAVYIENGAETVTIIDSSFDRNIIDGTDTAYGGAVYLDHAQAFNIANSTFAFNDNTAVYFGYGAMSLNFTTFAYNTTGADTGILGINFAGTSGSSKFVVNNSILHDGTDISGGEISGTAYSFGGTVTITAGQSTNNIYTNFNKFSGAANLAGTVDGSITAYLPYNDQVNYLAQQTATIRDSYANLVGSSAGTTSAFITANLYLATDMDYTGNRTNRVLALQSANSIANRYIYNGEETFAGNISETKSYDRSGAPVNGLMLIDYISSVYGWSSHSGGVSEYQVSADVKPFVVYSNGVALTEVAITEINSLYEGQWTWDSVNNRIVVRLADNADPNSTVMTTLNDTNSTIIYDQRGNMRSGVNVADASVVVSETNWTVYSEENNEYQASSDYAVTGVSYDGTSLTEGTDIENLEAGQWIWDSVNNLVVIKLAAGQSPSSHELDLTTTQTVYTYYTYGELNSTDTWIKVTVAESGTTYAKAEAADVHAGLGAFKANLYMTVTTNADNSYSPYVTYGMPEYMSMDNALADGVTLREGVYWIDTYDLTDLNVSGLPANAKFDADRYVKFADSMFEGDNNLINLSAGQITTTSNVVIGMIDNYNDIYYETGGASPTKYYFEGDNSFIAQNDESRITISGIDRYRIFDNSYSADHSAQEGSWSINPTTGINNMTLTDGFMSNSIINRGSVKWTYLARGGAIYNGSDATMYLNNTVVKDSVAATGGNFYRGHGGGIYNAGTMVIQDSTITGNFADGSGDPKGSYTGLGGGIYNNGTLTVARSLISENHVKSVVNKDDGLNYSATGGGIYNASGTLNLYSSTLSGNYIDAGTSETVDGAALTVWSGIANIYGNTIAYNSTYDGTGQPIGPARPGYAVYLYSGNVSLRNNILAQNYINGDTSQNRRDIIVTNTFELGTNFEDSYNIIGSYYLASGYYDFSAHTGTTHDILGFNSSGLVPNLNMSSELLYNGGMTQNYRIQTGSRAVIDNPPVDIYSGTGIDYDQRNAVADTDFGAYRITIGAYELLTKISVSSAADDAAIPADGIAYDYKNGRGGWTVNLRNALYLADENAVVTVTVVDNYDLVAGELLIFNGITLNTVDDEILTIDAAEKSRIFAITDPISAELVSVVLNNLNLINGKAVLTDRGGLGGAIYATERLTLNDVSIDNVSAESHGGAIYSLSGGLILTDVTITNAEAAGDGGAINQQTDAFTATRLTISGSKADGSGGAIYITDGSTFTIHGSLIHDNESGAYGGGIYFRGGDMNIYTTYVYNNAADSTKDGGGLYVNSSGNITIVYSTFGNSIDESLTENNGNTALRGAGIFVYAGSLAMTNSTISGNTAVQNGGGLYFDGTTLSLTYVTIANNYAGRGYLGGGVYMQSGTLNMINTVVAQNHALTTTSSTPSDFYVSTNASVNSAEFSAIGQSNFDFSVTTPDIHDNIVGNASGIIENLGLDTSLYDNGGGTPTLYVGTGSVLLGAATPISVTTSQNNHTPDSRGATPTIGAYEGGNFTTYYYVGDHKTGSSGRVNDTESWNTEADGSGTYLSEVGDFNDPGNLYVFTDNTYDGNLSTGPWTISDRSYVTVEAGGSFEISGAGSIQALVQRTGAVTNMVVDVENDGSLTFANALTQHVSLSSLGTGSYVSYTYGGTNQTVYTANYGNLTLSNSYYKTAEAGTITVNGTSTGLEVNNTNFILNGNLLGSANITLTDGTITGGAHDIISTGALSGTGANSISGNDISFASAPAYEGNITATGTVSISGQTGITGNISGSAVSIDGGGDTVSVTGNITSTSGSIDIQSANSTIYHSGNLISAADIAVYGTDSTITVGNATTSSGDIYLGSDTSGANVASLAILADSSVASVSGTIYLNSTTTELQAATLGSASNSNLEINGNLEATAGINTIYYNDTDSFTHAITIDDATLNFNIGSNNATITGAVSPTVPWLFNLNNFTVNDGTLGIVTTGNITINDVVTSALGNFHGTFSVTCKDIMFSGTNDFVGGYMDFIFNNSGYFKLSGDLEFENSITINDVMLYDSSVVNATLTSYNGNVTVGNVTTDPGSSTTPYVSEGNITLQAADGHSVSIGGTSGNINNVTLTSSTGTLDTATVAGPINNSGNLLITAGTTYVNSDVNSGGYVRINGALNLAADIAATSYVRASGDILVVANSSITGDNLQLLGGITGTGNLALGATGSGTNTLLGVTLTGGNLSLTDGSFEVDDLSTENISAANIYIASGAALDMGDHSLEATSGSITNAGTLNSDADISAAVNITNTSTGDLWAIGPVTATSGNIYNRGTFEVLTLGATAGGNIINSGLFSSSVVTAGGSISNTGSFTSTFLTQVDGNLSNTGGGTFTVTNVLDVVGNITNTGTLAVDTLNLIYSTSSSLSLNGDVSIYSLHVAPDKVVSLTSGNIAVNNFTFEGSGSSSKFNLASGTSLEVTGDIFYNDGGLYNGSYFNTAAGGQLIRTMDDSNVEYRVGNNSNVVVVTLNGTTGERIAVGVINGVTVNGETVAGIEETVKFTVNIDRNYGGGGYTNDLVLGINWATAMEGDKFDPTDASLFTFTSGEWTPEEKLTIDTPSAGRHEFINYVLEHNGTYTVANTGGDLTVPPIPNNVNIYEMANAHFMPMHTDLDCNIFLNFGVGVYPYFPYDIWVTPENSDSVGRAVYRQMEYRLISNPLTNPLYGQVPPPGEILGQAITEQASLTLTADAPIYLEVNGEYSVGKEWLPITEPATVENIEQFQEPITQGQIDQFYLDFGDREDIFEKAAPFKSDLDEMLDDLLAG